MGRKKKNRRQRHGSVWHLKQPDCWYYTLPGTKKRMPLCDEGGRRIRGKEKKEAAELALAREKLSWGKEQRGATKLDDFPRHAQTIYLADYEYDPEASHIQVVLREDDPQTLRSKLRWLDVYSVNHLPSSDVQRRVARDRHDNKVNVLFVDGHSDRLDPMKITAWDFGLPRVAPEGR